MDINKNEQQRNEQQLDAPVRTLDSRVFDVLVAHKRVTRFPVDLKQFTEYMETIRYLNSQPRFTTVVGNTSMDKYRVPQALVDLILPDSVTLTGGDREKDYLVRPGATGSCLNAESFNNITSAIANAYKRNDDLGTPVSRSAATLSTVGDRLSVNGYVAYRGEYFFPIPSSFEKYAESSYNEKADDFLIEALRNVLKDYGRS